VLISRRFRTMETCSGGELNFSDLTQLASCFHLVLVLVNTFERLLSRDTN
jgi:hypothetical protein